MLRKLSLGMLALAVTTLSSALAQDPPVTMTWEDVMAKGVVPYRQLTIADFPVNDSAQPAGGYYIKTACYPYYGYLLKPHTTGWIYAYIQEWKIFSGLDKKGSWRKSQVKNMKAELPFAQALLDLNEIYARQLAALKPGELPSGRGATPDEAKADLEGKLKPFLEQKYAQSQAEMDAISKATNKGADKKKVRELAAEIRKRLDALPATTVPYPEPAAASSPGATPASAPSASPPPAAATPAAP